MVCTGNRRGAYRILVGKPEGKKSIGRLRRIWEDNTKMDLYMLKVVNNTTSCVIDYFQHT